MSYNYDHIGNAMLTLFHKTLTAGWALQMYYEMKSGDIDSSIHDFEKNKLFAGLLTIIFMFICSLFILNIFIGMVISSFNRGREQITKFNMLNYFQKTYLQYQEIVVEVFPIEKIPDDIEQLRLDVRKLIKNQNFERFIFTCLILNSIVMCLNWYQISDEISTTVEVFNSIFMFIFIIEFLLRFHAYHLKYF